MGMAVGSGDSKTPKPVVNVTPLVDVALVVLIIFMVVTPMMTKTFWLNLPQQDAQAEKTPPRPDDKHPLVMTITKDGKIRVNQTELRKSEIADRLPRMLAAHNQRVLYFDAHDDVAYAAAVEVMDQARAGGARSIAIVTESVLPND